MIATNHATRFTIMVFALVTATCCHSKSKRSGAKTATPGREGAGRMEPKINRQCDFSQVESTFATYPCTPKFAKDEEDVIRINAPEEVGFSPTDEASLDERNTNFIVCGAMKMRAETLHKLGVQGNQLDALRFVAVDVQSHASYTGPIRTLGSPEPMPDDLKRAQPPMLGYTFTESFNPNLVKSFELPAVETEYDVHAVLGPYKSNVLRVKLRKK
jgi:hypothetical protein